MNHVQLETIPLSIHIIMHKADSYTKKVYMYLYIRLYTPYLVYRSIIFSWGVDHLLLVMSFIIMHTTGAWHDFPNDGPYMYVYSVKGTNYTEKKNRRIFLKSIFCSLRGKCISNTYTTLTRNNLSFQWALNEQNRSSIVQVMTWRIRKYTQKWLGRNLPVRLECRLSSSGYRDN